MKTKKQFGEHVEGYTIPVLNEREIRAAAGILFVIMFLAILLVILKGNFLLLKYGIVLFLVDILIRVFVSPKYAPTLIIGRYIVRKQTPEYVGAIQKKFAWKIGAVLAGIMFILQVIVNSHSPITGLICFTCLIFLFFESAFGICLGCKFYPLFYKDKVQYCPGEICTIKERHEIQKISKTQTIILITVIASIIISFIIFNNYLQIPSSALFDIKK